MTETLVRDAIDRSCANAVKRGEPKRYEVSVWSFPEVYADETVRVARALNDGQPPHKRMQTTTAETMSALGCRVIRTDPGKPGHHSIRFRTAPTDTDIRALMAAYSPARLAPREDHDVQTPS